MRTVPQHRWRALRPFTAALIFAALTANASAQTGTALQAAMQRHCHADLKTHCARIKSNSPEALACLQKHMARLAPACRKALREIRLAAPAAVPPPAPSPAPPPAKSTPEPAPIVSMPPPRAKLPPPHHAKLATVAAPSKPPPTAAPPPHKPQALAVDSAAVLHACERDRGRICPGAHGETRALSCLIAHERALTWRCRTALKTLPKRR